jgi:hypothetical protein
VRLAGVQVSVASECCKLQVAGEWCGVTFASNNGRNETFLSKPLTECGTSHSGNLYYLVIDICNFVNLVTCNL